MEIVVSLLVVGALLLLLETILPGLVAGILGFICLVAGVVEGYVQFGPRTGNFILLGVLVGLIAGTWLWLKYFPDSRLARRFVLHRVVGNIDAEKPELLHQTGVAQTL